MGHEYVFMSYSRQDQPFVERLTQDLIASRVPVWIDVQNIRAGTDWQKEIEHGLLGASILVYVASKNSYSSRWVNVELKAFLDRQRLVIPIVIDDEGAANLPSALQAIQWADFRTDYNSALQRLLSGIRSLQQLAPVKAPKTKSKGYVFISYADADSVFVRRLRSFLGKKGYAYWDFRKSNRDYQRDYFLELEGVIRSASATLSVISPNWKLSELSMQEFYFSREVGTPVFLLRLGEPGPTLALAGLSHIDFTAGFAEGAKKLDTELKLRGL